MRFPVGRYSRGRVARYNAEITDRIRIIQAIPGCGSFEVCFADGRVSQYFYFDDIAGRRLRPEMLICEQALGQAKALARRSGMRAADVSWLLDAA